MVDQFFEAQGYKLEDKVLYQDNMSAIRMEKKQEELVYRELEAHFNQIFFC